MKNCKMMTRTIQLLAIVLIGSSLGACKNNATEDKHIEKGVLQLSPEEENELHSQASSFFVSVSSISNKNLDAELIALGKKLYLDKRLSKNETISCASCHNLNNYGVDNLALSPGDTKELGGRNSPSVYYASLQAMQFWDGRAKDVEEQAGGPILNPVEHSVPNKAFLENRLRNLAEYKTMFAKAFPDEKQAITFDNVTKAIGAFERQLHPVSRFDKWLDGSTEAMTYAEKKGLKTFIETGCITCHNGVGVGGGMLQKFGLFGNYWEYTKSAKIDFGRFDVTKEEGDKYFFKVSSLRNIAHTYPYFHDGSVTKLEEAVKIMAKLQNNKDLDDKSVTEITTFLKALTMEMDDKTRKIIE